MDSETKAKKREYMKNYMRQYRLKKKAYKPNETRIVDDNVWAKEQNENHLPEHTEVA